MDLKFEGRHIIAIMMGMIGIAAAVIVFRGTVIFVPMIAICLAIGASQHVADYFSESKRQKDIEMKFPDFVRNLVAAIKSGMPMSIAIINASKKDYGSLTPHVQKLANQVGWAIPIHKCLDLFAKETNSTVIQRSVSTVIEAEMSGGNIEDVLETITSSVIDIKKIKEERKSMIHGQVVQSYIIFIVFIGVMIVIQNLLIPYIANMGGGTNVLTGGAATRDEFLDPADVEPEAPNPMEEIMKKISIDTSSPGAFIRSLSEWFVSLKGVFLMLALVQGCFAGLVLGKLSEGEIRAGYRHSMVMMAMAFFVISIAQGMMGG